MIIEISLSFYTLDLVIVAFLLSRDFPLFQGLALTLPAILAADVPLSPTSTIGAYQGTSAFLKQADLSQGETEELLTEENDAFYRFILPKERFCTNKNKNKKNQLQR